MDVGSLNTKFTEALRILERFDSVRQELEVDPLVFARCIATWKNNGKVPDLHLEVNLFGPSAIKDTIGSLLSKSKIYLQRPLSIAKDIVVDNPQLLRFPNLPSSSEAQIELSTNFVTIGTSGTPSAKISTVLEDLDQNQVSSDAAVEVCVLRPLLE